MTIDLRALFAAPLCGLSLAAFAGGGPLGIDHRLSQSDTGIWSRSNQLALQNVGLVADLAFAVWEGGETRLGKAAWQSVDSMALSGLVAHGLKPVFGRKRPSQTDDPNQWGGGGHSFPSGEVATISGIVTPYVLEYARDEPAVYALELLPVYDGIARMKSRGHWQTDVLAGFAIGTGSAYLAHKRDTPFILGLLPHGMSIGLKKNF